MLRTLVLAALVWQRLAAPMPIPVDLEPQHHIAYTNEALRVLQVNLPIGYTTLDHTHANDLLTVNIENGPTRTREGDADWSAIRERAVGAVNVTEYTGHASAHVVRVVGDKAYRLTGVENRRTGGWSTLPPVTSENLRVSTESRAFRAYTVHLPAGASDTHTHQVPVVVVVVEGAVRADSAALAEPGAFAVVAPGQLHSVTAVREARVVEVEVR